MTDWQELDLLRDTPRPGRARLRVVVRMPARPRRRGVLLLVAAIIVAATLAYGTGYRYRPIRSVPVAAGSELPGNPDDLRAELALARVRNRKLKARLERRAPRGVHIVIDQTGNRLYLKRSGETLLEAVCSAGSGMVLQEGENGRRWVFDTPRGYFEVLSKLENPVWRKPDWAYLEEGKPIPSDPAERIEYGTLGEYALYFGDGYMVHGTLYERLLGRSVTHGCIRLGRDDLREVYGRSSVGTPIYIH